MQEPRQWSFTRHRLPFPPMQRETAQREGRGKEGGEDRQRAGGKEESTGKGKENEGTGKVKKKNK